MKTRDFRQVEVHKWGHYPRKGKTICDMQESGTKRCDIQATAGGFSEFYFQFGVRLTNRPARKSNI